jgi:hypothetical protein
VVFFFFFFFFFFLIFCQKKSSIELESVEYIGAQLGTLAKFKVSLNMTRVAMSRV